MASCSCSDERSESIISKASQPALLLTNHEPPRDRRAEPERRAAVGIIAPLADLLARKPVAVAVGPGLWCSAPHRIGAGRRQFGPRSGGEAAAEGPLLALQFFCSLSGSLSGLRCATASGWVWVCAGLRVDALRLRSRSRRSIRRRCCFRLGRGARAVVPPAVALGGDRRRGVSGWKRTALTAPECYYTVPGFRTSKRAGADLAVGSF